MEMNLALVDDMASQLQKPPRFLSQTLKINLHILDVQIIL